MSDIQDRVVDVRRVRIGDLIPNPKNWKDHPKHQTEALNAVLENIGFAGSVLVREVNNGLMLLDGHLRSEMYPDIEVYALVTDITEEEETTILLTFDPISNMAEANQEKLIALRDMWDEQQSDLSEYFNQVDMLRVKGHAEPIGDQGSQIDKADLLQQKWKVERGQLWSIGKHRLMCGDSTNRDDVNSLLNGDEPSLMVTDPPYGVDYDPDWRSSNRTGKVSNDNQSDWGLAYLLSPSYIVYCWHASSFASVVEMGLVKAGYQIRNQIIWNKPTQVLSRGHYHWKHEPCFYGVKEGRSAEWIGDRKQTTVWDISSDDDAPGGHSTQKPIECMMRPLRNHAGDVYDPFCGSGTTLVAAEQMARRGYGMEIEPKYCAAILERMTLIGLSCDLVKSEQIT